MVDALNFQRAGAVSNAHAGSDFEAVAARHLAAAGILVQPNFGIEVGFGNRRKIHRFDLGATLPPVIVECKSHTWTSGGNMPSAKLTVWNEAMYYFNLAPPGFRKIFFVLKNLRRHESLAECYVRLYSHMIPDDVEVWEYCEMSDEVVMLFPKDNP